MSYKRITKGDWTHRRTTRGYDIENEDKLIAEVTYRDEEAKSNAKLLSASKELAEFAMDVLGDEQLFQQIGAFNRVKATKALKKAGWIKQKQKV